MICAILYLENTDKSRFSDLKNHIENNYFFKKAEYPGTVTVLQSLLLNYQPNYNTTRQSQFIINQLMFAQRGKTGVCEGETKYNLKNEETLTTSPSIIVDTKFTMQ